MSAIAEFLIIAAVAVLMFWAGMQYMRTIVHYEQQEARYDAMRYEYYRMTGFQKMADPRPYVPPNPITPREKAFLPGMNQLGRMMREGKRGTIMWRPRDRRRV